MDPELQAMAAVQQALEPLPPEARTRVLEWAAARHDLRGPTAPTARGRTDERSPPPQSDTALDELIYRAQPESGAQRALIAAFHLQEMRGRAQWGGKDINDALKALGGGLTNVTRTLGMLSGRKPPLVTQVSKSGRSAQARNSYRLTSAGMERARAMLAEGAGAP